MYEPTTKDKYYRVVNVWRTHFSSENERGILVENWHWPRQTKLKEPIFVRSRSKNPLCKKPNPKTKTIVANCICSWLRFWRTWKYIFTFVLTNSKLILFYQPKSNSPQRKTQEVAVLPANVPAFKCPAKKILFKRWRVDQIFWGRSTSIAGAVELRFTLGSVDHGYI